MTTDTQRHARVCAFAPPHPKLIHPLHDEFHVYGGGDVVERARAWALNWHYLLVEGLSPCAHALYLMDCYQECVRGDVRWNDHTNLWVELRENEDGYVYPRPFLLSATYDTPARAIPAAEAYAHAHGLGVEPTGPWAGDDWYYPGYATPIRLGVDGSSMVWPIERELASLLSLMPVSWPADEEDA